MNEAELVLTEALKCPRSFLYLNRGAILGSEESCFIASVLKRRMRGEPLAYILGKIEFMGLEFKVSPDVFIPRPETEILVETALRYASCAMRRASCVEILDIGTGSGCIAISLARLLSGARLAAVDISGAALVVAENNAIMNGVREVIDFFRSDLFAHSATRTTQYDIIVSNPPYIPTEVIDTLQPEVRQEPRIALDGGNDGTEFYRRILAQAVRFLAPGGFLILETGGTGQTATISGIVNASVSLKMREVVKDYSGIERVMVVQNG